jgi:hypothetical protein
VHRSEIFDPKVRQIHRWWKGTSLPTHTHELDGMILGHFLSLVPAERGEKGEEREEEDGRTVGCHQAPNFQLGTEPTEASAHRHSPPCRQMRATQAPRTLRVMTLSFLGDYPIRHLFYFIFPPPPEAP